MRFTKKYIFRVSVMVIFLFSVYIFGFSSGITGQTKKNGNGCTCHGNSSSNVNVTIDGPEVMDIGSTENFTITISGGPLVAAGTNISTSAGALTAAAGLQIISGELTHQQPRTPTDGKVTFSFTYTAPTSEGVVTMFANGNSVNLNGSNSGDEWNYASNKIITIQNPTNVIPKDIPSNFTLNQNYPNPFNPSTTITYNLSEASFVNLTVYDAIGNVVKSLVREYQNSGNYNYQFSTTDLNLSSGIYYYKISTDNFSDIKKMILLK